jgi:hypothetical protein
MAADSGPFRMPIFFISASLHLADTNFLGPLCLAAFQYTVATSLAIDAGQRRGMPRGTSRCAGNALTMASSVQCVITRSY